MGKFSEFQFLQNTPRDDTRADHSVQAYADEDDLDQCLYYLRTLSNILRWSSENMWAALGENTISTDTTHRSLYLISKCLDGLFPLKI